MQETQTWEIHLTVTIKISITLNTAAGLRYRYIKTFSLSGYNYKFMIYITNRIFIFLHASLSLFGTFFTQNIIRPGDLQGKPFYHFALQFVPFGHVADRLFRNLKQFILF